MTHSDRAREMADKYLYRSPRLNRESRRRAFLYGFAAGRREGLEDAAKLRQEGWSLREIAAKLKVAHPTVQASLTRRKGSK